VDYETNKLAAAWFNQSSTRRMVTVKFASFLLYGIWNY